MTAGVAQISLTCIWLETILYGVNCILYSGCMFVLFDLRQPLTRSNSRQIPSKTILFACTFLFATATVHVVLSFIQLLHAFTNTENASTIAFADNYLSSNQFLLPNGIIYVLNGLTQFLLFIWRLYMVAGHSWKPCIIPLVIITADACCSFIGVFLFARDGPTSHSVKGFAIAGWTMGFCLNTGLSAGISYYLWDAQRRVGRLFSSPYKTTILLVVESGALIASCELVMMCLNYAGNIASLIAISVAIQVATASPLLIVVRVGMGASRSTHTSYLTTGHTIPRFGHPVTVDVHIDTVQSVDGPDAYPMQLSSKPKHEDLSEGLEA